MGIALHSIIIGIVLGVSRKEFVPLLTALSFHQFFEGMALSTIIIQTKFKKKSTVIATLIAYGFSTPIGISIGILIVNFFRRDMTSEIIITGILEAFGAGILIYDVLVNIVAPHFLEPVVFVRKTSDSTIPVENAISKNEQAEDIETDSGSSQSVHDDHIHMDENGHHVHSSFVHETPIGKVIQLLAMYLGAGIMALIGKWA
ncbi:hypothetical protein HK096_009154 [Nowakowskiella sp. JEL0078]|nr:hypothetical protein HK096_009154 [Nowakowskiella sp. JEL0078]